MNTLGIFCLSLLATVSSSSIEDRLLELENQQFKTYTELIEVKRDNAFLRTEVRDLKHEDGKNKQQIQQLVQENSSIQLTLAQVMKDREADHSLIQALQSQLDSLTTYFEGFSIKLEEMIEKIQEIQSTCFDCCSNEVDTTTTTTYLPATTTLTDEFTTESIPSENISIDIGTEHGKLAILRRQGFVAVGSSNGVDILDLRSKKLVRRLDDSTAYDLKSFKDDRLIQASADGIIKIRNVETGEMLQTLRGHTGNVLSLALNKNQSMLLSGGQDKKIFLWDLIEYKQIRYTGLHVNAVTCVSFYEARNQLISGSSDNTIIIWSARLQSHLRTLRGHTSGIRRLIMDEQSGFLYSASNDKSIIQWDVQGSGGSKTFNRHGGFVSDVILSDDGQKIISSSADKSIIIWNQFGREENRLYHNDELFRLALNPLNGQIMSTTTDSKLIFWSLKP